MRLNNLTCLFPLILKDRPEKKICVFLLQMLQKRVDVKQTWIHADPERTPLHDSQDPSGTGLVYGCF